MMRWAFIATFFGLVLAPTVCAAQQYCDLLLQPTAVGANPPSDTAEKILETLSDTAGFSSKKYRLRDSRDAGLRAQGAAAQMCNGNERWIFYNPDYVEEIRVKGQSNWPKYFIFAHEVAHHVNNDPLDHSLDQESQADYSAARWLTRMGAEVQDLVYSINAFVVNETEKDNYPSRCERIGGVILAYDEEAKKINSLSGVNKPLYDVVNCMPIAVGGGLYSLKLVETGGAIQAQDVLKYGMPPANTNLPLNFDHDVSGMCATARLRPGDRLTWSNIGVCALMNRN